MKKKPSDVFGDIDPQMFEQIELQNEYNEIQKQICLLIDKLSKKYSPPMVASSLISRGVFVAFACAKDYDPKINDLIVSSVKAGKEAANRAKEELEMEKNNG